MFVTQEQFDYIKERYKKYKEQDYPGIDRRMIRIVDYLNRIDGVATIWCCEGHYGQLQEWHDDLLLMADVIVGVRDINALSSLFEIVKVVNRKVESPLALKIELGELIWLEADSSIDYYPTARLCRNYRLDKPEDEERIKLNNLLLLSESIWEVIKENHNV